MPVITMEFDDTKVSDDEALQLSNAIQKIVSQTTQIEDVFVYANSSRIKVKIAPIEIWVKITAQKVKDKDELLRSFKDKLSDWKQENKFKHPINLTLVLMDWKFEIGI